MFAFPEGQSTCDNTRFVPLLVVDSSLSALRKRDRRSDFAFGELQSLAAD